MFKINRVISNWWTHTVYYLYEGMNSQMFFCGISLRTIRYWNNGTCGKTTNKKKLVPLAAFSYFTQRPCRLHKVGVKVMLVAFREKQKWSDTAHPICCWKGVGWYQCLTSRIKLLYIDFFFFYLFPKIRNLTHVLRLVSHTNFSLWFPPFWNSLATLSVHVKKYKTSCLCTSRSNLSFSPPRALTWTFGGCCRWWLALCCRHSLWGEGWTVSCVRRQQEQYILTLWTNGRFTQDFIC